MNLPKYSNCVLDWRAFDRSFRDHSGNNNHGTPTGCYFQKKPDTHVILSSADLLTVADSPELQGTEWTIIPYGNFDNASTTNMRFVDKTDAGGTQYKWYAATGVTTSFIFDDGTTASTINVPWLGAKSVAVSCVSGSKPKGYKDGAFVADGNNALTITANDADLIIGNSYAGGAFLNSPIKGVLIYNTVLTDEEIAQAHAWIMATKTPSYPKKNFVYPSQIVNGKDTKYGSQLLTDGDMEASGVAAWTAGASAALTKETGTRTGGSGTQVLKVARDGVNNPSAQQSVHTIGKRYKATGWVRSDGSATPRIVSTLVLFTGTTSTSWQEIDITYTAANPGMAYQALTSTGTEYVEWDDLTVTEVKETVAAYDMKNVHGKIIDKTGNGNNGTITGATQEKGIGGLDSLKFKAGDKIDLAGLNLTDFNGIDWTVKAWVKPSGASQAIFGRIAGTPRFYIDTNNVSYDDSNVSTFPSVTANTWHRYVITYDGTNITTYLDGVQTDQDAHVVETGFTSKVMAWGVAGAGTLDGSLAEGEVLFYAESQAEITADYNKYAKMPYFLDSLKDSNESISANGGVIGSFLENTAWKFGDATARYKISRDSIDGMVGGSELLVDGDMETSGVAAWTSYASGALSKETSSPHSGTQNIRITSAATVQGGMSQTVSTVGKKHRVVGWAKGDGVNKAPKLYNGGTLWTGTTSTDWQYFDIIFTTVTTYTIFYCTTNDAGYVEFDDIQLKEIDANDKVIECTTAGMLYQEMQQAYGTYEFSVKKGVSTNNPVVGFIMDSIEHPAITGGSGSGYALQMNTSTFARVMFAEKTTGTSANVFYTNTAYVDASGTWYHFRITRQYDGQFTMYIKGGEYVGWTLVDVTSGLGTNPTTDNTTTASKYVVIDIDAGDMVTGFRFTQGVITP